MPWTLRQLTKAAHARLNWEGMGRAELLCMLRNINLPKNARRTKPEDFYKPIGDCRKPKRIVTKEEWEAKKRFFKNGK
jgi:hypothetical protein